MGFNRRRRWPPTWQSATSPKKFDCDRKLAPQRDATASANQKPAL
jgi:hypothetical protein